MKKFILFSLVLLIAIWAGLNIEADPGYVLFAYKAWTIEMPLWFFIVICLAILLVIYLVFGLMKGISSLFSRLKSWMQHRQSAKQRKHQRELAERENYVKILQEVIDHSDVEQLQQQWKKLPTRMRKQTQLIIIYVQGLLQHKQSIQAEAVLEKALRRSWDTQLIELYGLAHAQDLAKQLRRLEKWLKKHGESAMLMLTLGRIASANRLWGKARYYLQRSIELQPSSAAHYEYGTLLEQLGETKAALQTFREGLKPSG